MAETNANWDEHSSGAGFDLGAAHGEEHGGAGASILPWRGGREILPQQKELPLLLGSQASSDHGKLLR